MISSISIQRRLKQPIRKAVLATPAPPPSATANGNQNSIAELRRCTQQRAAQNGTTLPLSEELPHKTFIAPSGSNPRNPESSNFPVETRHRAKKASLLSLCRVSRPIGTGNVISIASNPNTKLSTPHPCNRQSSIAPSSHCSTVIPRCKNPPRNRVPSDQITGKPCPRGLPRGVRYALAILLIWDIVDLRTLLSG